MTVYVDNMRAKFGRMVMCHMSADTLDELLAMADRIGIARKWLQQPPKASWVHFDIALSMRAKAVAAGAVEITMREMSAWEWHRRTFNETVSPADAYAKRKAMFADKMEAAI